MEKASKKTKTEGVKNTKKRLVVLDTHAIIHRAYHAIPDFTTSSGKPTGALYGLSTMIMRIIADLKPDYMVAAYDLPQKTFRHEAYEAYKGTRQKTDDVLVTQLIESREVVEAFGIPILDAPGFEADDVIGTIAHKLKNSKTTDLIIASGDMDTMQLVNNSHIFVYTLKKTLSDTILYNEDMVVERYGFKPEFIVDYKGLRGDTSDNIIGIAGIGEKTATILIQTYGSIESIYKALKKDFADFRAKTGLSERLANLIKDNQDEAIFSKTLATIRHDAPVEFNINECDFRKNIDTAKLREVFTRLEFRSLVNKIDALKSGDKNGTQAVNKVESHKVKSGDVESIANAEAEQVEVPKDIALMTTLIYSDYIDPSWDDVMQVAKVKNHDEVAIREALVKRMTEEGVLNVYKHIEEPLIEVVDKMEKNGIKVNVKFLQDLGKKYHTELDSIEKSIFEMVGTEFNINSPKQLGEVLFDKLELNKNLKIKKSAGGKISTRESELEKMRDLHPAISQILEYRELQKLLSTYLDVLPTLVDSNDRIHATFNQIGAVTGRFSSKNPNLQNIPIKTERGRVIRDAFIAEDGYSLVVLDYAQVELRLAAVFSQDVAMLDAFNNGKDIHTVVAAKIFHVTEGEVTKNQRRSAKTINFGILYGMGVNALREGLGSSRAEAQEFYDAYYKEFATLANYLESVKAFARENGFTQTLFGRKRIFNSIKSPLPFLRAQAERMAINAPIQGTQADMTKLAMIAINSLVQKKYNDTDVKIVLQVHDELVYEVKDEITSQFLADVVGVMSGVVPESLFAGHIPVKFDVSGGIAKDWGSVK